MKKIIAKMEKLTDGTYFASCCDGLFTATGSDPEIAKIFFESQILHYRLDAHEKQLPCPDFHEGEYEIVYEGDVPPSWKRDVINPDYINWKIPLIIVAVLALIAIFCVSAEAGIVLVVFLVFLFVNFLVVGVVVSIINSLLK